MVWVIHKHNDRLQEKSEALVNQIFSAYFEQQNLGELSFLIHPQATWFGSDLNETCHGRLQVLELLEHKRSSWTCPFSIVEYRAQSNLSDQSCCVVYGHMSIAPLNKTLTLPSVNIRFTITCTPHEGQLCAYHISCLVLNIHDSTPEDDSNKALFVGSDKTLSAQYRSLLESELSKRTAELESKTQELTNLANNISGGIELCDFNEGFAIRYVSDGFLKLVNYSREELLGTSHLDLVHPADKGSLFSQIKRQIDAGEEFSVVYRILQKNGAIRWVLDNGNTVKTEGSITQLQCFLTDITTQKLQENELRVSQKRYEVALQQMDISMFEYDIATKQLMLYEQDASLYGMPTVIKNAPQALVDAGHFDSQCVPGYLEMYRKICSGEAVSAHCFMSAHDVDNKFHEFELTLTAVLDESGTPIRAIGVKRSVSNRLKLMREQEFAKTMTAGRNFVCEADISHNRILHLDPVWAQELGVSLDDTYAEALRHTAKRYREDEEAYMLEQLDAKRLIAVLEQGDHLEHFSFQKIEPTTNETTWHEITVNVIHDDINETVCVRIYHEDISERKLKEIQADNERHLFETMVSKAMVAYEVNITLDFVLQGHEKWAELYGIEVNSCYSDMIRAFCKQGIEPPDSTRFMEAFNRQNVLRAYYSGRRELSCQYRKHHEGQGLLWVECTMHLFEDPESGDVRGYSYVENIDKQKRAELELRYKAEHDAHTNLYNRAATAHHISDFLNDPDNKTQCHAFFMIDLDYFKHVNDHFGHVFGDEVIADMGARLRTLFRNDDIIGRLGGDEFCAFMKNTDSSIVSKRAEKLCQALVQDYVDDSYSCTVSASVGVALYPLSGRNFEELYHNADNALYEAKRNGRNGYVIAS